MTTEQKTSECRIVSYNILSQTLVSEENLIDCDPKHLQEEFRRDLLQKVLETEVQQKSIICLQEVNTEWAAWLYTWFDRRKYYFINTHYSSRYSGYMGTSIAISKDKFLVEELRYLHPFKEIQDPKPTLFRRFSSSCSKLIIPALVVAPIIAFGKKRLGNESNSSNAFLERSLPFYLGAAFFLTVEALYKKAFPDRGPFHSSILSEGISARHRDTIPMVKLSSGNREAFWVATVHMPCKFWNMRLMTAFACQIANTVQSQAGESRYILAGDFNISPSTDEVPSGVYELYTRGKLDSKHPHFPVVGPGWEAKLQHPMVSAYKKANGKEPELTTYSNTSKFGLYANTLDYIWLSPRWDVLSVDPLMGLDNIERKYKSCPCEENMSDHLKIAANLKMIR